MTDLLDTARALDAADPLGAHRDAFLEAPGVTAYLDGNSLGRPLRDTPEKLAAFVRDDWGTRLIRSWDEQWMALPMELGDRIGRVTLGAAAGQTVVADSTSVLIYKLMRAALRRPHGSAHRTSIRAYVQVFENGIDCTLADGCRAEFDTAHAGLGSEGNETGVEFAHVAATHPVLVLGEDDDRTSLRGFVGKRGQLCGIGEILLAHAAQRLELCRLPIPERDRACLVE